MAPAALANYLDREKRSAPDLKVILRADRELAYNWIAPILISCAQANIKSVNFSTKLD
jgi:biopolymer transport protein ExbD